MSSSRRPLLGLGVLAATAVVGISGVTAHARAGAGFDLVACDRTIRADLTAEFGSVAAAAPALGYSASGLGQAVADTCVQEAAGAQDAAAVRSSAAR